MFILFTFLFLLCSLSIGVFLILFLVSKIRKSEKSKKYLIGSGVSLGLSVLSLIMMFATFDEAKKEVASPEVKSEEPAVEGAKAEKSEKQKADLKAQQEAEAKKKVEEEAKVKADEEAKAKADAEAKKKKEEEAKVKAENEAKAKVEAQKAQETMVATFQELIKTSNGVIVDIRQNPYGISDYQQMQVVVSDAWYYSAEHEKERFAELVGGSVKNAIYLSGVISPDKSILVDFVDTYDKEVASEKIFGGYKIKE